MRKYEPIWLQLKNTGEASLIAPIDSHVRIKRAVRKEKYNDTAYTFTLLEKGIKYELVTKITGKRMKFSLKLCRSRIYRL